MRVGIKQIVGTVAALAIALHTTLWAAVAPFTVPSVDPFTVICHSDASAPAEQTPVNGPLAPAHACDHCNLCSAVAPPVPYAAVAEYFVPVRTLEILLPISSALLEHTKADPKLARGPPAFA